MDLSAKGGSGLDLKGRSQEILRAVIHLYIKTGSPVGSRTITQSFEFGLSPATIRNIMADLEELGFLAQPHTSAGRVPTEKGYRFYVDYFSSTDLPEYWEPPIIEESQLATKRDDLKELLQETSQLLSLLSHYMGIVVAPNLSNTIFRQLELIRLR
jgi:heat-inducible transcriptional repressor